jgi:CRISPR-associated protein Cmr6
MAGVEARRSAVVHADLTRAANADLVLRRYLERQDDDEARARLLDQAVETVERMAASGLYALAFERREGALAHAFGGRSRKLRLRAEARLAPGVGGASPLDVGLRLEHVFGVPILPGSAVRGVARHRCEEVWGRADARFAPGGEASRHLFGTSDHPGRLEVLDGWAAPETLMRSLGRDVTTPHHPDYHRTHGERPPTPFDSPIPVTHLTAGGEFVLHLAWTDAACGEAEAQAWLDVAERLVLEALAQDGVGGRTRAGYGRLRRRPTPPARACGRSRWRTRAGAAAPGTRRWTAAAAAPSCPAARRSRDRRSILWWRA